MICSRCGLPGAIDIDTGSRCHAELMECIVMLRADRERLVGGIERAPCEYEHVEDMPCAFGKVHCTCWKREALEGE